jgi:hypothetical protein
MIAEGGWPQVDFRETVLLENAPACEPRAPGASPAIARIVSYGTTKVEVEAEAPQGGGWVVLNDVWHPYWFAKVDGAETDILRANVLFRAVRIPEGRHSVTFSFEPLRGLWKKMREKKGG